MEEHLLARGPDTPGGFGGMGQPRQDRYGEGAGEAEKGLQFPEVVPRVVDDKNQGL
jgi:hypothetical protein